MKVEPGDIFLTRNAGGEINNPSPGYYNHAAIYGKDNWVIEAQAIFDAVIAVPVWNFFDRYPEILVLRNCQFLTAITADCAFRFIGRNYTFSESFRPLWRWHDGDNCVSLIRRIYNHVTGDTLPHNKWRIPDDFLKSPEFEKVALKKDYENFIPPKELYKGMVYEWPKGPAI